MPPLQHQRPAGLQQEEQPHPRQQLARVAADEEKGGDDFVWDNHNAAVANPAALPGKNLECPSAAPSADGGDLDSYPGAIGISVFTFLKIVGTVSSVEGTPRCSAEPRFDIHCCIVLCLYMNGRLALECTWAR